MSVLTPQPVPAEIEAILRAAEVRALERSPRGNPAARIAAVGAPDEQELLTAARLELQRCSIRRRLLPDRLSSESSWTILVDLFVRHLRAEAITVSDWEKRAGGSAGTVARMIAGLIEEGFVGRDQKHASGVDATLFLTETGYSTLRTILSAY